ncbi:MHC class II alpha chain [Pelobates cultripes]|uniref:MHC class II alpha chain n=2 Tax=Pelobates cultripes TaxID=61616 RepID=A0AAD1T0N0_PELCU|nr:MHC class II alpha chain [Pelobates cultripes]
MDPLMRSQRKFQRLLVTAWVLCVSIDQSSDMAQRWHCSLFYLPLLCVLCLHSGQAVKVENVLTQSNFYQTEEPTGEYMFQFDEDEIFYVDLDKKETKWRLPQFGEVSTFEAAGALQNIGIMKQNLNIMIKRSNHSAAVSVRPEILTFTENPVVFGEPNTLICYTSKFFPPVIGIEWLKNGQPVAAGVSSTDYYPASDGSFSRFLYAAIIPEQDDVYTCSVTHDGLKTNPTYKTWSPEAPAPYSEMYENVICGLGLAVGILGIIIGIVLIFKAIKNQRRAY